MANIPVCWIAELDLAGPEDVDSAVARHALPERSTATPVHRNAVLTEFARLVTAAEEHCGSKEWKRWVSASTAERVPRL